MITAQEIGKYIASPGWVKQSDLDELKSLTEKYPYSQIFPILYLKGMKASNSVDFESALKQHSYRISDRAQLYRLIHDHEATAATIEDEAVIEIAPEETETKVEVQPEPEIESTAEAESIEENTLEETPVESEPEAAVTDEPKEETDVETEHVQEESEADVIEESTETVEPEEEVLDFEIEPETVREDVTEVVLPKDALDESILHHALANQYQLSELTPEEESALKERLSAEEIAENKSEEAEEVEEASVAIDTKQSFTGWLHANANYDTPDDLDKKAIHAIVEDFSEFDPMESLFGEIEKPKKEFFSPTKKAKESLREDQLPVSETLAKIYIMQGNYPMAIKAYKELSLAFPEKKIFFANQIEDLKKKLNK